MPKKKTFEEFVSEAKQIHGDKYDYSLAVYRGSKEIIEIVCPKHDVFRMTPFSHIVNGNGCRKCYNERTSERQVTPLEDVLNTCKEKFNNKYIYNVIEYRGLKNSKVEVTCPIHGKKTQSFERHLNSVTGCKECSTQKRALMRSTPENEKEAYREYKAFVKSEVSLKNKNLKWFYQGRTCPLSV